MNGLKKLFSIFALGAITMTGLAFSACSFDFEFGQESSSEEVCQHYWVDTVVEKAECEEEGLFTRICKYCEEQTIEILPALEHKFGAGNVCELCGLDKDNTNVETDYEGYHNWDAGTLYAVTCTTDGYVKYQCMDYGCNKAKIRNVVKATGHNWAEDETLMLATCQNTGEVKYVCLNGCGEEKIETVPVQAHELKTYPKVEPTCVHPGSIEYYVCYHCEVSFKNAAATAELLTDTVIEPTGHNPILHEAVEATCTQQGKIEYWTCDNSYCRGRNYTSEACDVVIDRVTTPVKGHFPVEIPEIPATCTESGRAAYWICGKEECDVTKAYFDEKCAVEIKDPDLLILPPTHSYVEGVCEDCGAEDPDYVAPPPEALPEELQKRKKYYLSK